MPGQLHVAHAILISSTAIKSAADRHIGENLFRTRRTKVARLVTPAANGNRPARKKPLDGPIIIGNNVGRGPLNRGAKSFSNSFLPITRRIACARTSAVKSTVRTCVFYREIRLLHPEEPTGSSQTEYLIAHRQTNLLADRFAAQATKESISNWYTTFIVSKFCDRTQFSISSTDISLLHDCEWRIHHSSWIKRVTQIRVAWL